MTSTATNPRNQPDRPGTIEDLKRKIRAHPGFGCGRLVDLTCVVEVGHPTGTPATWIDHVHGTTVCDRHKAQYAERNDLGPFDWQEL